jgi:hypothetical protein
LIINEYNAKDFLKEIFFFAKLNASCFNEIMVVKKLNVTVYVYFLNLHVSTKSNQKLK